MPRCHAAASFATDLPTTRQRRRPTGSAGGFTMVELLVVIAIIVLIIAILLPVFGKVRANARTTTCTVNQRSIALAMTSYATDNAGRIPSPRTDNFSNAPGVGATTQHTWVKATTGDPDGAGPLKAGVVGGVETEASLENGVIFPYMDRATKAYRSPNDPTDRVRSYSINAYIGNQSCPDDWDFDTFVPIPQDEVSLRTSALTQIPQPAATMCSIVEESAAGFNKQGWIIDWYTPEWIDLPAFWDEGRLSVSYLDGSTRTLNLFSQRFINEATALGGNFIDPSGDGGAWFVLRDMLLPGRCDLNDLP
jgi:prepilin-type N-terminal cleavage/methylation domain-containing protein